MKTKKVYMNLLIKSIYSQNLKNRLYNKEVKIKNHIINNKIRYITKYIKLKQKLKLKTSFLDFFIFYND